MRRLAPLATQDHVRWYDLMRIVLSWALWRRPGSERATLVTAAQAAQTDVNRQREVGHMGHTLGKTIWEEAHEQGQAKGLAEGRIEGRAEGRTEGELSALRQSLRRLLAKRFGSVPEAVLQRIDSCTEVDRLMSAIDQILSVATPEDLPL
jgi:hypothetical protein